MRSLFKCFAVVLVFGFALSVSAQTPASGHRSFRFTYAFSVREVPAGKPLSIWFPEAVSDQWQDVRVVSQTGDLPLRRTKEKQYGDAMFHAETSKADKPEYHFEVVYEVTRRERVGYRDGQFVGPATNTPKLVLARFSSSDALVPTTGRLADLAETQVKSANADTPIKKARAIYDYVFTTMRYDKSGTGWGRGDSESGLRFQARQLYGFSFALRVDGALAKYPNSICHRLSIAGGETLRSHCWISLLGRFQRRSTLGAHRYF